MKLATNIEKDRDISITFTNIFKVGDLIYTKFFWVHQLPEMKKITNLTFSHAMVPNMQRPTFTCSKLSKEYNAKNN